MVEMTGLIEENKRFNQELNKRILNYPFFMIFSTVSGDYCKIGRILEKSSPNSSDIAFFCLV